MKKAKILLATAALSTAIACSFGVTACGGSNGNTTDNTPEGDTQIAAVYALYTANAQANGDTVLTYEQWLESIKGEKGATGEKGDKGDTGTPGTNGANGKSAYDIAVENGFEGDEADWLDSLKGASGSSGAAGATGATGKSAYDIAVENGFEGTQAEWLESLKGTNGTIGVDGKSAYDIAVENGFDGNEEEWLASLKGADGEKGETGVSVEGIYETSEGLMVKFTDGTVASIQNGGVEYQLLVVGENHVTIPVFANGNYGINSFSFYSLNGGTYRLLIPNQDFNLEWTYPSYGSITGTGGYDPFGEEGEVPEYCTIDGVKYWGTNITITAGYNHIFDIWNFSETDSEYTVIIEKV